MNINNTTYYNNTFKAKLNISLGNKNTNFPFEQYKFILLSKKFERLTKNKPGKLDLEINYNGLNTYNYDMLTYTNPQNKKDSIGLYLKSSFENQKIEKTQLGFINKLIEALDEFLKRDNFLKTKPCVKKSIQEYEENLNTFDRIFGYVNPISIANENIFPNKYSIKNSTKQPIR